jgi:hypothetical protein
MIKTKPKYLKLIYTTILFSASLLNTYGLSKSQSAQEKCPVLIGIYTNINRASVGYYQFKSGAYSTHPSPDAKFVKIENGYSCFGYTTAITRLELSAKKVKINFSGKSYEFLNSLENFHLASESTESSIKDELYSYLVSQKLSIKPGNIKISLKDKLNSNKTIGYLEISPSERWLTFTLP